MSASRKSKSHRSTSISTARRLTLLTLAIILGFIVVSQLSKSVSGENGAELSAARQDASGGNQDADKKNQTDPGKQDKTKKTPDANKSDSKKSEPTGNKKSDDDDDSSSEKVELSYDQMVEAHVPIHEANKKIQAVLKEEKEVPGQDEGTSLIEGIVDTFNDGTQIKYSYTKAEKAKDNSYTLISAGPDGKFGSEDNEKAGEDDISFGPFKVLDWQAKVDKIFGDYLVIPMNNVLFFDFFTGEEPKVDADYDGKPDHPLTNAVVNTRRSMGVNKDGWLGTSVPFVVVWLLAGGLFFTFRMRFINFRGFWHAIRLTKGDYDDPKDQGDVSHFQALSAALSATVGLGNIAGVAIAINRGGPGATFWMIMIGLIGMSSKFTECTLGQMYRKVDNTGRISGGPMHYLKDGLSKMGLKPLGIFLAFFFSILCIGGSIGGGNTFQVVQSLGAIKEDPMFSFLQDMPWIYGIVMVTMVGLVIVGGIKVIGRVAGSVVPFMCGIYVLFAVIILGMNAGEIPSAFAKIFTEAFTPDAVYGGFIGVLVIGITRAVFSNEAGTGSAAIAHSAAKTDVPVREGIVALLEPFIDTVVVCTMTALVVIITGAYNSPETLAIREAGNGAALTSHAFQIGGFEAFKYVLFAAVFLFAFSTCISWSYYGERCWTHWFGQRSSMVYKILFLVFTFLGSIVSAANIQAFSDILILSMALPNVLGVLFLSGSVRQQLDAYWNDVKSGKVQPKK